MKGAGIISEISDEQVAIDQQEELVTTFKVGQRVAYADIAFSNVRC